MKPTVFFLLDDDSRRPYVQFLLHNQPHRSNKLTTTSTGMATGGGTHYQQSLLRCDLHDRASRVTRDIQRAQAIFEEEKLTYLPPDDEDDDDNDDISDEQQEVEPVPMT